jgi:hypothetical protein
MEKDSFEESHPRSSSTGGIDLVFFPEPRIYRDALTFVDRSYFLIWKATMGATGEEDPFGISTSHPEKSGPTGGCFWTHFRTLPLGACESDRDGPFCPDMAPMVLPIWKGSRSKKVNT